MTRRPRTVLDLLSRRAVTYLERVPARRRKGPPRWTLLLAALTLPDDVLELGLAIGGSLGP